MQPEGPRRLDSRAPDFARRFAALTEETRDAVAEVTEAVAAILADIRDRGDWALVEYTRRFDRHEVHSLAIGTGEVDAAVAACAPETLAALGFAAERIKAYHDSQKPQDLDWVDPSGVRLGARWRPLESVGLYVPGGTAAYPSSVLMN